MKLNTYYMMKKNKPNSPYHNTIKVAKDMCEKEWLENNSYECIAKIESEHGSDFLESFMKGA